MSKPIKLVGVSGSLRKKSVNTGMLRAAQRALPEGVTMEMVSLIDIPFYNADFPEKTPAVKRVLDQFAAADGFVFACPEYNYSIAPALKNILDWASREPGNTLLAGKAAAIMGAAGGMGSSRSQYHLRQVCVCLDLHLVNKPEVFGNAFNNSFDEHGDLLDTAVQQLIKDQMLALVDLTRCLKIGCC